MSHTLTGCATAPATGQQPEAQIVQPGWLDVLDGEARTATARAQRHRRKAQDNLDVAVVYETEAAECGVVREVLRDFVGRPVEDLETAARQAAEKAAAAKIELEAALAAQADAQRRLYDARVIYEYLRQHAGDGAGGAPKP